MLLWILSIVALALAPLLHSLAHKARSALDVLDGFVLVTISGIVLMHIIPHAVESEGWIALLVALAGLLGPGMTERAMGRLAKPAHVVALLLAVAAVAVHTFMDGAALGATVAQQGQAQARTFAIAVILHRIPEGLMIWWLVRPSYGVGAAAGLLAVVGASTSIGFFGGHALLVGAATRWLALFQALVAGSLLHVVTHRPHPIIRQSDRGNPRRWSAVGALAGLGVLAAISDVHGHDEELIEMGRTLVSLSMAIAPAMLGAYVLSGLVHAWMPSAPAAWLGRGGALTQAFKCALYGMPLPICSCGAVERYRSLAVHGVPAAAAVAFLLIAPLIGIDAALLSLPLLGASLTLARIAAALLLAVLTAALLSSFVPKPGRADSPAEASPVGAWGGRLKRGLRFGLGDMVDETGPWMLLGVCLAALAEPTVPAQLLTGISRWIDVPVVAVLGAPVYFCAAGATPIIAVLVAKGLSPGAGLAFLLIGPAMNLSTLGELAHAYGRRIAGIFGACLVLLCIAIGYATNLLLAGSVPTLPAAPYGAGEWIALGALVALLLGSLLRQGPRGFLGQVASLWPHRHEHDEGCNECCEHDHVEHDPCECRREHEHEHEDHAHEHGR